MQDSKTMKLVDKCTMKSVLLFQLLNYVRACTKRIDALDQGDALYRFVGESEKCLIS
jgi:hypothetical protein